MQYPQSNVIGMHEAKAAGADLERGSPRPAAAIWHLRPSDRRCSG